MRNLPFKITPEELYDIFGKYGEARPSRHTLLYVSVSSWLTLLAGAVFQIRLGERGKDTKGTAFVVYEDIYDAKRAVDHLSGFNVGGRYLVVQYYQPAKFQKKADAEEKKKELEELRRAVKAKKAALQANE